MFGFAFDALRFYSAWRPGPRFEWDPVKDQRNFRNHGMHFSTATLVFNDPMRLEYYDVNHSDDEDRYLTVGHVRRLHRYIAVIYTMRDADTIRIISARAPTRREMEEYHDRT